MDAITNRQLDEAWQCVSPHVRRTPILTSRLLDEETGFRVALKAEMFQRTGAYKIRGALNKLRVLSPEQKQRGVICSSAGNHAQGVALAAALSGVRAVVVMAENATPSKIAATQAYGAQVILHGTIWDDANEEALRIVAEQGLAYVHPFDDQDLIAGQATLGREIVEQLRDVEVVLVPIGGGGLISGVAQAVKRISPRARVVGVESSGAPGMRESVRAGRVVTLDAVDCVIDGLRVRRVGELTREMVARWVDDIVTVPDADIFESVVWLMSRQKLVAEGAAAATVAALRSGLVKAAPGARVVCLLSGGNLNLDQLAGLIWN
ncbi:MAG TPA: threonine/serine dehydratase [Candidatus Dormibacteraeota bacterium]|nr:threonine/serine dehydratase [Candidatus Dormibacteraeota bacterium]